MQQGVVYEIDVRGLKYFGLSRDFDRRLGEHEAGLADPTSTKLLYTYARATNCSEFRKRTRVIFRGPLVDCCIHEIVLIREARATFKRTGKQRLPCLNVSNGGEANGLTDAEAELVSDVACLMNEGRCSTPGAHGRCSAQARAATSGGEVRKRSGRREPRPSQCRVSKRH